MRKEASIYMLGFKKGRAQFSFFKEAIVHAKESKDQNIFFIVSEG